MLINPGLVLKVHPSQVPRKLYLESPKSFFRNLKATEASQLEKSLPDKPTVDMPSPNLQCIAIERKI